MASRHGFGLTGAAGWIARVHLEALARQGQRLVFAMDPSDAGIAILDEHFPDAHFFHSEEEMAAFLAEDRLRAEPEVRYLTICSPDHCHRPHMELALAHGVEPICEKPMVMNPSELADLEALELSSGLKIHPIMQHRFNPAVLDLRRRLAATAGHRMLDVDVTYVAHRGPWYLSSWRGAPELSAGLAMDIGIHFFDLVVWLFGAVENCEVHVRSERTLAGLLELERARVSWFLSIDRDHLPEAQRTSGARALRAFSIGGRDVDLTSGMAGLQEDCYRNVVAGTGLTIDDIRPGLELAHRIQHGPLCENPSSMHDLARGLLT